MYQGVQQTAIIITTIIKRIVAKMEIYLLNNRRNCSYLKLAVVKIYLWGKYSEKLVKGEIFQT